MANTLNRYWENQKKHGMYDNCIASSKFIAGKLAGLFRVSSHFKDYWNSPLLKGFSELDKICACSATKRSLQLDKLIRAYPNSSLALFAEQVKEKGRHDLSPKKLAGQSGEINLCWNGSWPWSDNLKNYNKFVLPDACAHTSASVCAKPQDQDVVRARLFSQLSLGNVRTKHYLRFLRSSIKMECTRNINNANQLLDNQVPLVVSVGGGGGSVDHWIVMIKPKGGKITSIDPAGDSANTSVKVLNSHRLSPGLDAGDGWYISRFPFFLYYVRLNNPISYPVV